MPMSGIFYLMVIMGMVKGFGVNDATYAVYSKSEGKTIRCKAYVAWSAMLNRAFGIGFKDKFATYHGVSVCDEWRSFMAFREWWIENHVDGWQLDKDLLTDDRVYSPSTCIYVPAWLNSFTTNKASKRGQYPIGVSIDSMTGMFHARCHHPKTLRSEFLGSFHDSSEAHSAWLERKLEIAIELKPEMDLIDERLYERVVCIVKRAQ